MYKVRKLRRPKRSLFFFFLLIPILGFGLYFLFFSDFLKVKNIQIIGNNKITADEIKEVVNSNLSKKFLFFLPNNLFLANAKEIKKSIEDKYLLSKDCEIKKQFPDSINISLRERSAFVCWQGSGYFLIDNTGFAYKTAENCDNLAVLKLAQGAELKREIEDKELLNNIIEIINGLKSRISIKEIEAPSDSYKIIVREAKGYEIYFEDSANIKDQIIDLIAVLDSQLPENKRQNLEYIDLRFGNKVFYKFK